MYQELCSFGEKRESKFAAKQHQWCMRLFGARDEKRNYMKAMEVGLKRTRKESERKNESYHTRKLYHSTYSSYISCE